jgi:hypothetical protein
MLGCLCIGKYAEGGVNINRCHFGGGGRGNEKKNEKTRKNAMEKKQREKIKGNLN